MPEGSSIRVLIVEDDLRFRRFVSSKLVRNGKFQIVSEVADGLEAIQKTAELQPDLILLDIGLPGLNGIDAARHIRRLAPKSRILFVSSESDAEIAQEAVGLGAWGYVVKAFAERDLPAALEAVTGGTSFASGALGDLQFFPESNPDSDWPGIAPPAY
jgi:DNA-binding NarL/FixJ family response regulator